MRSVVSSEISSDNTPKMVNQHQANLKSRVQKLRWSLLALWCLVTFVVAFFARDLNFVWADRPFGFWMAAQGAVLVFLAITWVYAIVVNRWEQEDPNSEQCL
jgi:putative solute:sodium symporter small subunit